MKKLFEEGLNIFHLRRPTYDYGGMKDYLSRIPEEYHNRIVLYLYTNVRMVCHRFLLGLLIQTPFYCYNKIYNNHYMLMLALR